MLSYNSAVFRLYCLKCLCWTCCRVNLQQFWLLAASTHNKKMRTSVWQFQKFSYYFVYSYLHRRFAHGMLKPFCASKHLQVIVNFGYVSWVERLTFPQLTPLKIPQWGRSMSTNSVTGGNTNNPWTENNRTTTVSFMFMYIY